MPLSAFASRCDAASQRDDIAAVVSLSPFSHPVAMMRRFLALKRIPFVPLGWLVLRYVEHVIGHRFDDFGDPEDVAGEIAELTDFLRQNLTNVH